MMITEVAGAIRLWLGVTGKLFPNHELEYADPNFFDNIENTLRLAYDARTRLREINATAV